MPLEAQEFDDLTLEWTEITVRMHEDHNALGATHFPGKYCITSDNIKMYFIVNFVLVILF